MEDFVKLLEETIPDDLGVSRNCGKAAVALLKAEAADPELFPARNFKTVRERMMIIMNCYAETYKYDRFEFWLSVFEYKAIQHENEEHMGQADRYEEDTELRQAFLEEEEPEPVAKAAEVRGWWNQ